MITQPYMTIPVVQPATVRVRAHLAHASSTLSLLKWPVIVFGATLGIMALLFRVLAHDGQLMYLWPITGIQLGLLLSMDRERQSRLRWALSIAAGSAALFVAGVASHAPPLINLMEAVLQGGELCLFLLLLGNSIRTFNDLKRRRNVFRLLLASTVVPTLTALALFGQHPTLGSSGSVIMADSLGVTVFVPVLLLAFSGRLAHPIHLVHGQPFTWAVLLLLIVMSAAIFSQTSNPILFLYFPPLILVLFSLGSEGATIASVVTSIIGSAATAHGSGPAWIAHGVDMNHRVLVFQLFIWSTVATALPIGALLDERRNAEAHASESQAIYTTLINHSKDMIVLARLDGSYRFVSPAVEKVTGYTPQEYGDLKAHEWVHPEDRELTRAVLVSLADSKVDQTVRYRAMHKNGNFSWFEAYLRGYVDTEHGPITGYVATVQDITFLKQTEDTWFAEKHAMARENAQLATLAGYDELTGICNRRAFNQALTQEATRQNRSADFLSLLMIDVDYFKKYNDSYGHPAGDVCLHQVAAVLKSAASRPTDLAARVGGEEFGLLLPHTDHAGALRVAQQVLINLRSLGLVHEANPAGIVTVSIGIATCLPRQHIEGSHLMQWADGALYQSKSNGRDQLSVWSESREFVALIDS